MQMFGKKQKPSSASIPSQDPQRELEEASAITFHLKPPVSNPQNSAYGLEESTMNAADLTASVSKNTVFTGNIVSEDNIEIFGEVEGSVKSAALVKIFGKVHGDVSCGVLVAENATIVGNLDCERSAVLGDNTTVHGNVTSPTLAVSGQINGNIEASASVSVSAKGAVYGDIHTPEIEVSKGAIVFGSVVMEQPVAVTPAPAQPQDEPEPAPQQEPLQAESSVQSDEQDDDTFSPWRAEKKREDKPNPLALG